MIITVESCAFGVNTPKPENPISREIRTWNTLQIEPLIFLNQNPKSEYMKTHYNTKMKKKIVYNCNFYDLFFLLESIHMSIHNAHVKKSISRSIAK